MKCTDSIMNSKDTLSAIVYCCIRADPTLSLCFICGVVLFLWILMLRSKENSHIFFSYIISPLILKFIVISLQIYKSYTTLPLLLTQILTEKNTSLPQNS
jgi:hypothetical protein